MKYNWPAVVKELRTIVLENVKMKRNDGSIDLVATEHFNLEMRETDTFHPWNSDGELSQALDKISEPACKDDMYCVEDALDNIFEEMGMAIREHYSNHWNFAPGTHLPEDIRMPDCWDGIVPGEFITRVIEAAKK